MKTVGDDNIYRFMAADVFLLAGAAPATARIRCGFGGPEMQITDTVIPLVSGTSFVTRSPIVGPNGFVIVTYEGGDVLTALLFRVMGVEVPLGTVFYV